ncbi:MAG: (2Fe-2S)-binding protein [Candidatus Nitrohelix vancouverensis]|uniref:(2Fe-2S)-binding protein n=1 Tax=Candidatus Nitrohelix vancouverensis TaxID=2705534 RepID=A0A7T0C3K6_9BACT|nr:MAG: (2Fe-2S)-binding protein [Candidatus Nitrohelix vancouverensis]
MDISVANQEEIICKCYQVSETTIRKTIEAGNLESIDSVTRACGAGGGCHSCHILIQLFIDEHQQANAVKAAQQESSKKSPGFFGRLFGKS